MDSKKLLRVYKKVTAEVVYVWEVPKTEYKYMGKEENGESKYEYVTVPDQTIKEEVKETLYEQKFDENDLDVRELTLWANRIK